MIRRPLLFTTCAAALVLTGCSTGGASPAAHGGSATTQHGTSAPSDGPVAETQTPTPTPTVGVAIAPAGATVSPDAHVTVTGRGGTLKAVTVTGAAGTIPGVLKGGTWAASQGLVPGASYVVTSTVVTPQGTEQVVKQPLAAAKAGVVATYHVLYDNMRVGVGAPVTIQFDSAVTTKEQRAQIERHAVVTTSPAVDGSWGWLDNRQLMWRPATYWKPGTTVTLAANIQGLQTGPGKYIGKSARGVFTVGPAMISTVDMKTHTMTVTRDGKVLKTIPVSTGKSSEPRFVTRSGTKVIIEKNGDMTMDSSTVGIPEGSPGAYRLDTNYNLRVTWTGEFLHSAPWSVGAQGRANVSHGCTNLAPANARWMFENSSVGDVIVFTGSNRPFRPTEGIGVWEYSFDDWKKQSALSA